MEIGAAFDAAGGGEGLVVVVQLVAQSAEGLEGPLLGPVVVGGVEPVLPGPPGVAQGLAEVQIVHPGLVQSGQ